MQKIMQERYLSTAQAAQLSEVSERMIRKRVQKGAVQAQEMNATLGGGVGGITYAIPLSELSIAERIRYFEMQQHPDVPMDIDLGEYRGRFKTEADADDAINELFRRQQAVLAIQGLRAIRGIPGKEEIQEIAERHNVSPRGLYRWEEAYLKQGLAGLLRKARADRGESRSMCAEAKRFIYEQYLSPEKKKQAAILDKLLDRVVALGPEACEDCPYNPQSYAHASLQGTDDADFFKPCYQVGQGILAPANRHAVNRLIAKITPQEVTYMRKGRKAWEAAYMMKASREKPEMVNEAWYGDHHQFDVFCIDENGRLCRPWLTAWYDIGSGVPVGWCISKQPNSETITEAFARAVAIKRNSPIRGVPAYVYIDNGKDYRGKRFEGGSQIDFELGRLNGTLNKSGILNVLHVQVRHALPYHGWAKPVERWFGTLEERFCTELPGYCGGDPNGRPENFMRQLSAQHMRGELLTLDELSDTFLNEILPAYNNRPHSGYNDEAPMARYMRLPKARNEVVDWRTLAIIKTESSTRKVSTQGILFEKVLYWHPDLRHMVGEQVTLRYNRGDKRSLTVCDRAGRFVCEVEPKEYLRHVGEDEATIAKHVAMQKQQENEVRRSIRARGVRLPGKRSSGLMFYEIVDETARGNLSDFEAARAAKGKEETRSRRRAREQGTDEAANRVREMMIAEGAAMVSGRK